jgi:hypothetical protein
MNQNARKKSEVRKGRKGKEGTKLKIKGRGVGV